MLRDAVVGAVGFGIGRVPFCSSSCNEDAIDFAVSALNCGVQSRRQNMDSIISFLVQLIIFGGGGAAVAYALFQYLGSKWIENKFAERLEQVRHTQALELQRLRVEIDSLLSGAIKLQEKEFQTLPEAWIKLDEAYGQVSSITSPVQTSPQLDRLHSDQLEEFLTTTPFTGTQKDEIRKSGAKTSKYDELMFRYRAAHVRKSIADLHNYVERHSIFMPPELKGLFEQAADDLWSAMSSKEVGHESADWKLQNQGWDRVKKEVEPQRKAIGDLIYARLQAHGKR